MRCEEMKYAKMKICKERCCYACIERRKTKEKQQKCMKIRGLNPADDCEIHKFWK